MTDKKPTTKPKTDPKPAPKIGHDAIFRKGGYEPIKTAPANPQVPSKPGTSSKPVKSGTQKD